MREEVMSSGVGEEAVVSFSRGGMSGAGGAGSSCDGMLMALAIIPLVVEMEASTGPNDWLRLNTCKPFR